MRMRSALMLLLLLAGCGSSSSTAAEPFRVLVTNDDGVRADGISALVEALRANRNVDVVVFAQQQQKHQSGAHAHRTSKFVVRVIGEESRAKGRGRQDPQPYISRAEYVALRVRT